MRSTASLGQRILEAVDDAVEQRWDPAQRRAESVADSGTVADQVRAVAASFRHELGLAGAVAGGTAAVPGVGLATASTAFAVELAWSTMRLTDLILTIGTIHGHGDAPVEDRRLWVLSLLTHGDAAASTVQRLTRDLAPTSTSGPVPAEVVRQINRALGASIVSRYGTRRGALALGRAVPFGIGAALGYGLNSYAVKATARHAHTFFTQLPR